MRLLDARVLPESLISGKSSQRKLIFQYIAYFFSPGATTPVGDCTRVGTLIVATVYLQLIQNRYMFRSFTVLQCSHQHCVQPVASDVEVVGYL